MQKLYQATQLCIIDPARNPLSLRRPHICHAYELGYDMSADDSKATTVTLSEIVYNNFPWPSEPSEKQIAAIEQAAQAVLDARAAHPESSLADLYDPVAMPPDLRKGASDS